MIIYFQKWDLELQQIAQHCANQCKLDVAEHQDTRKNLFPLNIILVLD